MSVLRVPRTQQGIALGRNTLALLAWKTAVSINPTASRLKRGSLNLAARVIPRRGPCTWQLGHALNRRVLGAPTPLLCAGTGSRTGIPPSVLNPRCPHSCKACWNCGEFHVEALYTDQIEARQPEPTVGSGQFCTPWWRMHWLKFTKPISRCDTSAGRNWPSIPAGSRCWQPVGRVELGASDAELLRAQGTLHWWRRLGGRGSPARDASARNGRRRAAGSALTLPHLLSCRPRWMMSCRRTPSPAGLKRPCR